MSSAVFKAAPRLPLLAAGLLAWTCATAEPTAQDPGEPAAALPSDVRSVTRHLLAVPGLEIPYTATADALTVEDPEGRPRARIFFVAYAREDAQGPRPVTFVFNGGPGAASAYLHLGALGPRRVRLPEDGRLAAPPVTLEDNPETWLPFTDLVFVDPPGTGYSRVLEDETKQDGEDGEPSEKDAWSPWGVEEDAGVLAAFIRLWLTRENRWASPVYLVGESYGGFRAALLAARLPADEGIAPSGLVLISPVLDFGLLWGEPPALLPASSLLPTYAAVAAVHGRGAGAVPAGEEPRAALQGVEAFALGDLLTGLAAGSTRSEDERSDLYRRIAEYTGLPFEEVRQHHGRVSARRFAALLLQGRARLVSLYDGSVTLIDPEPGSTGASGRDIFLDRLGTALMAGFHLHARTALGLEVDLPYRLLSKDVFDDWDWSSGLTGPQGFSGVQEPLRRALSINPDLRVLVMHGVYDLVTPYFASAIVLRQLGLDPELGDNLSLSVYPGGHMVYTHAAARAGMQRDAERLYLGPAADAPAPASTAAPQPQPALQPEPSE